MKESAIKHKLRQVVFRHRKRFIEDALRRRPCNCKHNGQIKTPRHSEKQVVRLCLYGIDDREQWNNVVCDEAFGGGKQAQNCPYFVVQHEATDLKAMFDSVIGLDGTPVDPAYMAKHYPDIMALTWVLGDARKAKTVAPVAEIFEGRGEPDDLPEQPLMEPADG